MNKILNFLIVLLVGVVAIMAGWWVFKFAVSLAIGVVGFIFASIISIFTFAIIFIPAYFVGNFVLKKIMKKDKFI